VARHLATELREGLNKEQIMAAKTGAKRKTSSGGGLAAAKARVAKLETATKRTAAVKSAQANVKKALAALAALKKARSIK
jgi:hypothetical protein